MEPSSEHWLQRRSSVYWLLEEDTKSAIRDRVSGLVTTIAKVTGNTQADQLFPFVGRKDLRKSDVVIAALSKPEDLVVDPFSGSGIFTYSAAGLNRKILSNEWEPYTHRMSSAPWRLPASEELARARRKLHEMIAPELNYLYRTICTCGRQHVLDSLFFDRVPLRYVDVTSHVRLGPGGETVAYRQSRRCPDCGATGKFFDASDSRHLEEVNSITLPKKYQDLFSIQLIKNSRINLSDNWTVYGNLFPHRSKLALVKIWDAIEDLSVSDNTRLFLQDAFLAMLPQAKYKDYRSKSQDMHVPDVQLREVNLLYRLFASIKDREKRLREYTFSGDFVTSPIACQDFREFMADLEPRSTRLVLTDPPWGEGNAYFEKAQLYHPWLGYRLKDDSDRMENEVVITDAPSRSEVHNEDRWWADVTEFFTLTSRTTEDLGYLAMYFRPIPARRWLENLNRLKLRARMAGFEPLLSIDVSSADPSMRIQQSASFVFSSDIVFVFLKLPEAVRRRFVRDIDLDHLTYRTAADLQKTLGRPFTEHEWRTQFSRQVNGEGVPEVNLPHNESIVFEMFLRYTREVEPGKYLVRTDTPFTGQLFDVPAVERLFSYVPAVVRELTETGRSFTYDMFLLKLAAYVENGTRMLIQEVENVDMRKILLPYAVPREEGKLFIKRPVPTLPQGISQVMELDPYEFEHFSAELLRRQGFTDVAVQGGAGDRGVDIFAIDPEGQRVVAQCKRYIGNVDATPIQRLHSFSITRGAHRRIVITTSGYTRDARDEALRTHTELIDGVRLEELVAELMPDLIKTDSSMRPA